jgi:hypothetical protein
MVLITIFVPSVDEWCKVEEIMSVRSLRLYEDTLQTLQIPRNKNLS